MAIRSSSVAYIINEEEDGFVAVDFDIIDVNENEQQDLSSWEFIDRSDEEEKEDGGSSFDENT
ncbi:hypothetical protein Q8G47_29570, partial [Klebsiella pneumoniae]|uniref:hypothetical protein n=1 Tax=Klebsiella pneumoniae TaxID=573 RepID=UPI0030137691